MDLKLNEEGTDFIDGEGDIYQDIETVKKEKQEGNLQNFILEI